MDHARGGGKEVGCTFLGFLKPINNLEKTARNKKQKLEHEEKAKELEQMASSKHSAAMKQRHNLACDGVKCLRI